MLPAKFPIHRVNKSGVMIFLAQRCPAVFLADSSPNFDLFDHVLISFSSTFEYQKSVPFYH
jgi:hypothetical protein